MKSSILHLILAFSALAFSLQGHAINKCTDSNGKVSFQDTPCPKSSVANTVKLKTNNSSESNEVKIVNVSIENIKRFSIGIPQNWNDSVRTSANNASSTVRINTTRGDELVLLMSFLPNKQSLGMDKVLLNNLTQEIERQHSKLPTERKLESKDIELIFSKGIGRLITYADDSLINKTNRPNGQFAYITTGTIIVNRIVITVSILTNNLRTVNYAKAMAAIQTLVSHDS